MSWDNKVVDSRPARIRRTDKKNAPKSVKVPLKPVCYEGSEFSLKVLKVHLACGRVEEYQRHATQRKYG